MSIYPVKLIEWFPFKKRPWEDRCHYDSAFLSVKYGVCLFCGNEKMKYKTAWGHHSIPFGYGDIWCNKRCLKKHWNKK